MYVYYCCATMRIKCLKVFVFLTRKTQTKYSHFIKSRSCTKKEGIEEDENNYKEEEKMSKTRWIGEREKKKNKKMD